MSAPMPPGLRELFWVPFKPAGGIGAFIGKVTDTLDGGILVHRWIDVSTVSSSRAAWWRGLQIKAFDITLVCTWVSGPVYRVDLGKDADV